MIATTSTQNVTFDVLENENDDSWMSLSPPQTPFHSRRLSANLMRELSNRDPLFYYEAVSVLGVGSMGSVTKVRKRESVIGGSARTYLQKYFRKEKQMNACFDLPCIGGLFRECFKGKEKALMESVHQSSNNMRHSEHSYNSSIFNTSDIGKEDYNDGHGENTSRSKQVYAMKSIHLSRVEDPNFVAELLNEIHILRHMDHPHIVKPMETFKHNNQIFIVMELCTGGDLYSRDPYTEEQAARITRQILSAISYMHDREVLHRDLKYENILFVNNSANAEVKLIDFGLSKVFGREKLQTIVGTIYTMAPEVLSGSYTKQADLWSVGCISYMLLSSQMPFYGRKRQDIVSRIMAGEIEFKGRRWKKVSPSAKEFIRSLLVVDEKDRASAEEAFSSPWLNKHHSASVRNPLTEEIDSALSSVAKYSNYKRLKKVALMVIAHKSTSEEIGILRKIFEQYDTKRKGVLTFDEFKAAFHSVGYSEKESRRIFKAIDIDGTGKIRYTEFLAATIEARGAISEERLAEAFDRIDSDDSGYISVENLRDMLGDDFAVEELEAIIKEADLTNDNRISYAEFLALWQEKNNSLRDQVIRDMRSIGSGGADVSSSSPSSLVDVMANANFIENKLTSGRRRVNMAPESLLVDAGLDTSRSVDDSLLSGTSGDSSSERRRVADV